MIKAPAISPRARKIYDGLDAALLSTAEEGDDDQLRDADVALDSRVQGHRAALAFGVYSRRGLERALNAYGLVDQVVARGVGPIEFRLSLDDPFRPRMVLFGSALGRPVIDLTVALIHGRDIGLDGDRADARLLSVETLTLQHPGRSFEWTRPPLPGQEFPGLALFNDLLELLVLMARRTGAEGLSLTPSSFHAAWIYERHFQFVRPLAQGEFQVLRHEGRLRPLWLLAWAVELGCVKGPRGAFDFEPSPMLCPLVDRLTGVFDDPHYREAERRAAATPYFVNWQQLRTVFPWKRMPPERPPARVRALIGDRPRGLAARGH